MGLDIQAASHLRYVRPIPQGEEFDLLEQEIDCQDKWLDEVYFLLYPNDPGWLPNRGRWRSASVVALNNLLQQTGPYYAPPWCVFFPTAPAAELRRCPGAA
jgi:hypothetical protein